MSISKLDTPYTQKQVIDYASDYNTVLVKKIPLQHIAGTLYKTREKDDTCKLYAYYEEHQIGVFLQALYHMEQYTAEMLLQASIKNKFDSVESYASMIRQVLIDGGYIRNTQIKLMEHVAPGLVRPCIDAKAAYQLKKEQENQARNRLREEDDAVYVAEQNAIAAKLLQDVANTVKSGGVIKQTEVTIYRSRYDSHTYGSIFSLLSHIYAVSIPIKVCGWIAKKLVQITVSGDTLSTYRHYGKASKTFGGYMKSLIIAIQADTNNTVLKKWLDVNSIAYPQESQSA